MQEPCQTIPLGPKRTLKLSALIFFLLLICSQLNSTNTFLKENRNPLFFSMTKLHYVGFNGYHQCPKNETHLPKVITEWIPIEGEEILNISCTHRLLVVEVPEFINIHGILREDSQEFLTVVEKPTTVAQLAACEDYLIATEKMSIWKYIYKNLEWMKVIVSFTKKEEASIWEEAGNRILKVSFQHNLSNIIFLLSNGSVWRLSERDRLTLLYPYFDVDKAIDVSSGLEHSLILTESGCVLSMGNGSRGQLGHGDLDSMSQPVQIAALEGLVITKIATGGWHSCALTDSGDLCTWGWNNYGQLSAFEKEEEIGLTSLPVFVEFGSDLRVVDVVCGRRHTVAVLENGDIFSTGWNAYSQLGVGLSSEKVTGFTKCNIQNRPFGKLFCGPWYTILIEEFEK